MARIKKVSIMNASPLGNPFAYNSGGSSSFGNRLPPEDRSSYSPNLNNFGGNNYSMGLGAFNRQSTANVGMSAPTSGIKIAKPTTTTTTGGGRGRQSVGASGGSIFGGTYARKRMEKSIMCKCGSGMSKSMCDCGASRGKRMKKDFRGNYSMGNRSLSKASWQKDSLDFVNNVFNTSKQRANAALGTAKQNARGMYASAKSIGGQLAGLLADEISRGGIKPTKLMYDESKPTYLQKPSKGYSMADVGNRLKEVGKPTRRGQYDESNQLQRAAQVVQQLGEYLSPTKGKNILPISENPASKSVLRRINGVNTLVEQKQGRQKVKDGKLVSYDEYYKDWNLPKGPIKALTDGDVAGKKVNPRMQIWETATMAPRKNVFEMIIPQKETFTYDTKAKRYRSDTPTPVGSAISAYESKQKGRPAGVAAGGMASAPKLTTSNSGGTLADYQFAQELLSRAGYNLNNVPRKKAEKRMSKGLLSAKMPRMYPTAASNRNMLKSINVRQQAGTKHVIGGYRGNIGKRFAGPKQNKYME